MLHERINLKEQFENLQHDVYLTSYCPDNYEEFSVGKKRKCVIVVVIRPLLYGRYRL